MSRFDTNHVVLTGRLGQIPELKMSTGGRPYVRLSVAVDGTQSDAQWHKVMAWGHLAEQCAQFLGKGSPLLVEGRLDSHGYIKDNVKRHMVQVVAERVQFLSRKGADAVVGADMDVTDAAEILAVAEDQD